MKKLLIICALLLPITGGMLLTANASERSKGIVSYEAKDDYYLIYTSMDDFTIVEVTLGFLNEGDIVYGNFKTYGIITYYNATTNNEVNVWIEDWGLSKESAVRWLAEHGKLDYDD
jgi:hypothetical protein